MGIRPNLTEAVPTDGLHTDGSTDETQIGATYDELE
jgi:NH3-dependent NAD+ synthetase